MWKIVYFEKTGKENTEALFEVVDRALAELDIHKIVLASTRGDTARYAMDRYKGQEMRLIVVPHQYGFGPGQRFPQAGATYSLRVAGSRRARRRQDRPRPQSYSCRNASGRAPRDTGEAILPSARAGGFGAKGGGTRATLSHRS